MIFGKIVNGSLVRHNPTTDYFESSDGQKLYTGDEATLLERGYKQIEFNDPEPPEGYDAVDYVWTETADKIRREWNYSPSEESANELENMQSQIDMLTECVLEMSAAIYE